MFLCSVHRELEVPIFPSVSLASSPLNLSRLKTASTSWRVNDRQISLEAKLGDIRVTVLVQVLNSD
jgi:hypothetical protein